MIWLDRWRGRHLIEEKAEGVPEERSRFCMDVDDLTWKHADHRLPAGCRHVARHLAR